MHPNSKLLFEKYALPLFRNDMRVLEVGPDATPSGYCRIVGNSSIQWEGVDMCPSPGLTWVAPDEYHFPVPDNSFDVVLSGQVLEHVRKAWVWMREVARVCKPGGLVITINPVNWAYHEWPVDCWRIYPEGIRALHEDAGLTTQLALFESLAPLSKPLSPMYLLRQAVKPLLGRKPHIPWWASGVVDTISIGVKSPPARPTMAA